MTPLEFTLQRPKKYRLDCNYCRSLPPKWKRRLPDFRSCHVKLADGILTVFAGFEWDGATGYPDTPNNHTPCMIHDALYDAIRRRHLDCDKRKAVD